MNSHLFLSWKDYRITWCWVKCISRILYRTCWPCWPRYLPRLVQVLQDSTGLKWRLWWSTVELIIFAKLANFAVLSEVTSEHNRIIQGYPLARASAAWAIGHIGEGWQKNSCNTVLLLYCTQNCWFLSAAPHVLLRFICKCWSFVANGHDRSRSCPEMLQWPRKMPGRSWLGLKLRCVVNGQHVTVHSVLNPFISLHTTIKWLCVKSRKLSYFWTRVFCFFAAPSLHF